MEKKPGREAFLEELVLKLSLIRKDKGGQQVGTRLWRALMNTLSGLESGFHSEGIRSYHKFSLYAILSTVAYA